MNTAEHLRRAGFVLVCQGTLGGRSVDIYGNTETGQTAVFPRGLDIKSAALGHWKATGLGRIRQQIRHWKALYRRGGRVIRPKHGSAWRL